MQQRRVAVRGIIFLEGKLFCVRLKKYNDPNSSEVQDFWCTPGGGVNTGEPLIPALERELVEETGVRPVVGNLLYVQQFQHKDTEQLEFFFHVTNAQAYEDIRLEETSHGVIEIAEFGFIEPSKCTILPLFLQTVDIATDIAVGFTHTFNNFTN